MSEAAMREEIARVIDKHFSIYSPEELDEIVDDIIEAMRKVEGQE